MPPAQSLARLHSEARQGIRPRSSVHLTRTKEPADRRRDLVAVGLERKVAGVKEAHVCVWHVAFEGLRTGRQEEWIVLAPHRQKRRLVLAKIGLEFGIERDVALVVAEQV